MTSDALGGSRVRFGPEIFRIQRRGGVSRSFVELHQGLLGRGVDSQIVAGLHVSAMLAGVPGVSGASAAPLRPVRLRQAITRLVDGVVADRTSASLGPSDIWHPTYFPRHLPKGPRLVVTVFDMIHERFPDDVGPRDGTAALKAAACRAADLILCISRDTADDLADRFGIAPDRIAVTHLGVTPVRPAVLPRPFGDRPYLVFVGDRRPAYKNWPLLLDALAVSAPEVGLVCVGPPRERADVSAVRARGLEGRVEFEGGADDALAGRLHDAAGLVYPSRYEGFGLPPLEALAQGCPVVATAVGAIPEVVGELAMMVPPTSDGLAHGIDALLANGSEVVRQRVEGPSFAARYPWSATVDATIAAYRRVLG